MNTQKSEQSNGQGLVEYALLLVLISIVVIGILTLLGPQVGNVFSRVTSGLGTTANIVVEPPSAPTVTGLLFQNRSSGNAVAIKIQVSENTSVTITDSQGGGSSSTNCNGSCQHIIIVGGTDAGIITVKASGNSMSVKYPAN